MKLFILFSFLILSVNNLSAQDCPGAAINFNNTCDNKDVAFSFTSSPQIEIDNIYWKLGNGVTSTLLSPATSYIPGTYNIEVNVNNCYTENAIVNADFEGVNEDDVRNLCGMVGQAYCSCTLSPETQLEFFGFQSDYYYKYTFGEPSGTSCGAGYIKTFRVRSGNMGVGQLAGMKDHTPGMNGEGNWLCIDGSNNSVTDNFDVWRQIVPVSQLTSYRFACFVANATGSGGTGAPRVDFGIEREGVFYSMFAIGNGTYNGEIKEATETGIPVTGGKSWGEMAGVFQTLAGEDFIIISIRSYGSSGNNDLGIDDISLTKVCLNDLPKCVLDTTIVINECDPPSCSECVTSFSPLPGEEYQLSAWIREDYKDKVPATYRHSGVRIIFDDEPATAVIYRPSGPIIDGWQRVDTTFAIPLGAASISIGLVNEKAEGDVYFDDIRIHPFRSNMKSFVYDPSTQRLVAELDENNYATRYEYDDEGILIRVKKETERGVMTIKETRTNQSKIHTD